MSHSPQRPTHDLRIPSINPIGMLEQYAIDQDWNTDRVDEFELWTEFPTQWGTFRLWATFHENSSFLQFNCYMNLKVPSRLLGRTAETLTLINERIWLGHFEIWGEESMPVLRMVIPLRNSRLEDEQLDDIMVSLFQDAERFYPALQWVIWGGKSPEDAVATAILDTEGEA
ncbi:MAG: YbjN domain-containing protein [Magnetococcales bacterium]|nr:YbjN domain-containing protein [Magnetococcales bacterium]